MRSRSVYSLHQLASQGHEDNVKTLIEERYPLNIKDRFGRTALHCCVESYRNCFDSQERGILSCIGQLLEVGADPSIEDGQKRTVLDLAVLQRLTFYNTELPNADNLYYSPYGLDKDSASIKMGKLLHLLYNAISAKTDFSWLATYASQQTQPLDVLQILGDIYSISSAQLLQIILLRTLMQEKGQLNLYLLTAAKHGEKTALNLNSTEQVSGISSLLLHIYELVYQINKIRKFLKFEDTSDPRLCISVCEHFEELSKGEKYTTLYFKEVFKTLKESIYTSLDFNYLKLLLSFGKYSYVRLADLKPNLLNYLEGEGNIQKHLIEVFVLIVDWIEDRPEDRESGDQLREEIVREFNESCSLHFLIEHDLTGDSTYLNSASYFNTIELKYELIDFLINQALNCYGSHRTALHLAASTRNVNMLQYLIYEKDVYLYAVYKNFHTFYDVLIMSRQLVANTEDNRKSIIQKLISNLAHVMLLKPLKTLCAEKIVNNSSLLESARNKLGGCSKLMQLFSLHSTS